jgi:hypothetical protein
MRLQHAMKNLLLKQTDSETATLCDQRKIIHPCKYPSLRISLANPDKDFTYHGFASSGLKFISCKKFLTLRYALVFIHLTASSMKFM